MHLASCSKNQLVKQCIQEMQQNTAKHIELQQAKKKHFFFLNLTAFKRLRVNFESKVGCLYFFEKRSLTTDFLPTKEDSKTLCKKEPKKT